MENIRYPIIEHHLREGLGILIAMEGEPQKTTFHIGRYDFEFKFTPEYIIKADTVGFGLRCVEQFLANQFGMNEKAIEYSEKTFEESFADNFIKKEGLIMCLSAGNVFTLMGRMARKKASLSITEESFDRVYQSFVEDGVAEKFFSKLLIRENGPKD